MTTTKYRFWLIGVSHLIYVLFVNGWALAPSIDWNDIKDGASDVAEDVADEVVDQEITIMNVKGTVQLSDGSSPDGVSTADG